MSRGPSFTAVVPVYGVENYIKKFAETLLGQTYEGIQFVFVNDGTKDASIDILKDLIDSKFSHLRDRIVIVDKKNEGLPAARKTGMEYATGDYVLHLDSDDWLELSLFEKLAAEIESSRSDIVYFDFFKEYARYTKHNLERDYTAATKMKFIRRLYNYRAYGYVWNKCVNRRLYQENDITFPPYGMHEDICLMTQLIYSSKSISHLKEPLYHYRRTNPFSISAANHIKRRTDSAMNMLDLYMKYRGDIKNSPIRDVYGEILFRAGWHSIRHKKNFFDQYSFLAKDIRKTGFSLRYRTFILKQLYVRIYSFFK